MENNQEPSGEEIYEHRGSQFRSCLWPGGTGSFWREPESGAGFNRDLAWSERFRKDDTNQSHYGFVEFSVWGASRLVR